MRALLQIAMAALTALCYAIIYNIHGKKLAVITAGGAAGWSLYLLVYSTAQDPIASTFIASGALSLLSEVLARKLRAPVSVFLSPMLISLVPGGDLFHTAQCLVANSPELYDYARLLICEAGAIAGGIAIVSCCVQIYYRLLRQHHMKRYSK